MSPRGWHFSNPNSKVRTTRGNWGAVTSWYICSIVWNQLSEWLWLKSTFFSPSCPFFHLLPSLPVSFYSHPHPYSCRTTTASSPCSVRTLWWVCWTFVGTQRKWRPYWTVTWTCALRAPTTDPASAASNWPSSMKSRRWDILFTFNETTHVKSKIVLQESSPPGPSTTTMM